MKYHMDESYIDNTPNAFLYQRIMDRYPKSAIGCFIISEDWDEQALLELKEKSEARFLVGLQIDDMDFDRLDIIEGIVRCQTEDVNQVVKLLNISPRGLIGIDVIDIKSLFEREKSYKFIQTHITDGFETDMAKKAANEIVSQLPKNPNIKGLLLGIESSESPSLDNTAYIIDFIEKSIMADDLYTYYCTSMGDEPNSFRLRAMYAEEE
ncbi:hypothetical protein [Psychrobacter sp. NG27]|uniref:hypothetical protein n=1 Tax=Psychrobacter sp. NG27 TaxID=2781966 RepID=UPI0018DF0635|nr:hypothetical protein [Psychrobacter sp. NG27]MBI0426215.1 hypothetical protein [Psychrobacter sp. NG27]